MYGIIRAMSNDTVVAKALAESLNAVIRIFEVALRDINLTEEERQSCVNDLNVILRNIRMVDASTER